MEKIASSAAINASIDLFENSFENGNKIARTIIRTIEEVRDKSMVKDAWNLGSLHTESEVTATAMRKLHTIGQSIIDTTAFVCCGNEELFPIWDIAMSTIAESIKNVLAYLPRTDSEMVSKRAGRLSRLFILAYICQEKSFEEYFKQSFMTIQEKLNTDANFEISKNEIENLWVKKLYHEVEVLKNPYLEDLENVILSLRHRIE